MASNLIYEGPKEQVREGNIRNDHIYIELVKQHMIKNEHITRYLLKTIFLENHNSNFCIFAPEGPREKNYTPKCSQWPHLYTTYEATCVLK